MVTATADLGSMKPYLLRAVHEWCTESNLTPYLVVHIDANTRVPEGYAKGGEITLNVSYDAVMNLLIGPDVINFDTRFNSKSWSCIIPIGAVIGLHAKESGMGLTFPYMAPTETPAPPPEASRPPRGKPNLRIVK